MICNFCNAQNPDNAAFCHNCGKRIDGKVVCPVCHNVVQNAAFCLACGARLNDSVPPSAAAQPQAAQNPQTAQAPAGNNPYTAPAAGFAAGSAQGGNPYGSQTVSAQNGNPYGNPTFSAQGGTSASAPQKTAQAKPKPAPMTEKQKRRVSAILQGTLLFGAVLALVLVFFAGMKFKGNLSDAEGDFPFGFRNKFSLLYFFGGAYKDVAAYLASLEEYSALYCATLYIGAGVGSAIAAFTVISVAVGTVLAAIDFLRFVTGNSDKDSSRYSLYAIFAFIAGMFAMILSFSIKETTDYGNSYYYDDLSIGSRLNGAAKAGLIVSLILLAVFFLAKLFFRLDEIGKQSRVKTICSFISAAAILVAVCLLTAPLGGLTYKVSARYGTATVNIRASILEMVQSSIFSLSVTKESGPYVISFIAWAMGLAFVFLSVFALKKALCRMADPDEKNFSPAFIVISAVLNLAFMIVSIIAISENGDLIAKTISDALSVSIDYSPALAGNIVFFIFFTGFAVAAILPHLLLTPTEPPAGQNPYALSQTAPETGTPSASPAEEISAQGNALPDGDPSNETRVQNGAAESTAKNSPSSTTQNNSVAENSASEAVRNGAAGDTAPAGSAQPAGKAITVNAKARRYFSLTMQGLLLLGVFTVFVLAFFAGLQSPTPDLDLPDINVPDETLPLSRAFPWDFREKFSLLYFFGKAYKDVGTHLNGLEEYSGLYCALQYIGVVSGTVIAAFTLLSTLIGLILASVKLVRFARGDEKQDSCRYSVYALFAFAAGMIALAFLYSVSATADAEIIAFGNKWNLNGAAKAGLILSVVFLALYYIVRFFGSVADGKIKFTARVICKTFCSALAAGLGIAVCCMLLTPLGGIKLNFSSVDPTVSVETHMEARGSMLYLLFVSLFTLDSPTAWEGPAALSIISAGLGLIVIFMTAFALKATLSRLVEPEKRHVFPNLLTAGFSLALMIVSIIAIGRCGEIFANNYIDLLEELKNYIKISYDLSWGGYIAAFVLLALFALFALLSILFTPSKNSDSENPAQPLTPNPAQPGSNAPFSPTQGASTPSAFPAQGGNPYAQQMPPAQNGSPYGSPIPPMQNGNPYARQTPPTQNRNPYATQTPPAQASNPGAGQPPFMQGSNFNAQQTPPAQGGNPYASAGKNPYSAAAPAEPEDKPKQ